MDLVGSTANGTPVENIGFIHAFVAAISVILVSEIGDKTFFIAAIMAMRHPRLTVFSGAMTALTLMTVLSGNDNINVYKNGGIYKVFIQHCLAGLQMLFREHIPFT